MSIPGVNVLRLASSVIRLQVVALRRFVSRATNGQGIDVDTYAAAVDIRGSVQPLSLRMYQALGLDFNKTYVTLYTSETITVVNRGGSGDRFNYGGAQYLCESTTDWQNQDGWAGAIAVLVPPTP